MTTRQQAAGSQEGIGLWNRLRELHPLTLLFFAALVALVVAWLGLNDWRLPGAYRPPHTDTEAVSTTDTTTTGPAPSRTVAARVLSGSSPVRVTWLGQGEALKVTWNDMSYPDLDSYSVDVYGLAPEQTWYNVGYREDTKLASTRTIHPLAETRVRYAETDKPTNVGPDETWRICVTGMRSVPAGAAVEPYEIDGSKKCSDPFVVPR